MKQVSKPTLSMRRVAKLMAKEGVSRERIDTFYDATKWVMERDEEVRWFNQYQAIPFQRKRLFANAPPGNHVLEKHSQHRNRKMTNVMLLKRASTPTGIQFWLVDWWLIGDGSVVSGGDSIGIELNETARAILIPADGDMLAPRDKEATDKLIELITNEVGLFVFRWQREWQGR